MYDKWNEVYELFTQNDEYKRKQREKHEKYGYLRSGEGTSSEILQKIKEQEEQEYLQYLLDTNQYTQDPITNKKLYKLYMKNFKEKALQNDNYDLVPHHTAAISLFSVESSMIGTQSRVLQSLQSVDSTDVTISVLVEPYPSGTCYNGGQLANQTQLYYLCKQNSSEEWLRVDSSQYSLLVNSTNSSYECKTEDTVKEVCVCPKGYYGYQCSLAVYSDCYVNITDPPFYKGCKKEDSAYYMYSIPGFDPCFFLDFTKVHNIKFLLTCKLTDETGTVSTSTENVGYSYRDVIVSPTLPSFTYLSTNTLTGYSVLDSTSMQVQFTFFDWKWLSNYKYFTVNITDPDELAGLKNATIALNFSYLEESDKKGNSLYVAGGRAYFEADVLGTSSNSYTARGFFDKLGYVEPPPSNSKTVGLIVGLTLGFAVVIIGGIVFYVYWKKKKNKEIHID